MTLKIVLCSNGSRALDCTSAGQSCLDCWTSLNCIDLGNGQFLPEIQTCPLGRSCRNDTKVCENSGNYQCVETDKVKLKCHNEGTYPNPYDCRKYFICIRKENGDFDKYERECSGERAYDAFTETCNKLLHNDDHCISPVAICNSETKVGQVDGNPSKYFRCARENVTIGVNYVPHLYSCPSNFFFNATSSTCIDPYLLGLDDEGKCKETGRFHVKTDCHYYHECNDVGMMPDLRYCGAHYSYKPTTQRCTLHSCQMCKG